MNKEKLIKPKKLKSGDTIGVVSTSGPISDAEQWSIATNYFNSKGYIVKISPNSKNINGYLAGTDENRAKDLMSFFADKSIDAIVCARGGYGAHRILEKIDFNLIKENPKIFVGYSDITALLLPIRDRSNFVTFHGALAIPDFGVGQVCEFTEDYFFRVLEGRFNKEESFPFLDDYICIKKGETEGELIGGNLAMLTSLLGTRYFPDVAGKILLLEDVGEPLYKIDRMLMQLKLAGIFNKIAGLLFGEFTSIIQSDLVKINQLTPVDLITELIQEYDLPIGFGFPSGHHNRKLTLPLGVKYYFNSYAPSLILLENYFDDT